MLQDTIGDALFTKTQQKVLGLLFGKPDKRFYTNEIMRRVAMGRGTVSRELDRLVRAGLLTVNRVGNQNYYQANPECPVYEELLSIVRKLAFVEDTDMDRKVNVNGDVLKIGGRLSIARSALDALIKRYHIKRLALFGSAARGEMTPTSDIDLLVEFEEGKSPSLGSMVVISDAFSQLFGGRKVDLATTAILNNPYRRREIEKDMELLYAA
jgi:predicted nucleotidyltransferase